MKTTTAILAAVAATLPLAQSIHLNHAREAAPRVVSLPFEKKTAAELPSGSYAPLRKRQGKTVNVKLDNDQLFYRANLSIGTPAQTIGFTVDTGSSDLWTNVANSTLCTKQNGKACKATGSFNVKKSSSLKFFDTGFNASYLDASGASGNWVTDTVALGGATLNNFQFGLGFVSTSATAVLGIAYQSVEVANTTQNKPYPNMPLAMVNQGLIASPAYSMWLDDFSAASGQILFGGVNTAKYQGELQTIPIISANGTYELFFVALTDVSLAKSSQDQASDLQGNYPYLAVLDSGTSFTYVPQDLYESLSNQLGIVFTDAQGNDYADCSSGPAGGFVSFSFSGANISVPLQEFFLDGADSIPLQGGGSACVLTISGWENPYALLGDTFLRSAYVVFDLANNEVSLAQTKFDATADNIVEIGTGTNAVPSATAVASPVTSLAQASDAGAVGNQPTSTGPGLPGASASASATASVGGAPQVTGQAVMGALVAGAALVAAVL